MTSELNRIESIEDESNIHLLNEIYEQLDNLDKMMVRGWLHLSRGDLRKLVLELIRDIKHDIKRSV